MRTVTVHLDSGFRFNFAVGISADMWASINNDDFSARLRCTLGNGKPEESGTNNKKIRHDVHHLTSPLCQSPALARWTSSQ